MQCYNCGKNLTEDTNHKEHIPAKNLFRELEPQFKIDLLKVPACYTCNVELYSKKDHVIRDVIGIINEDEDLKKITSKATRSITRNINWKDRIFSDDYGKSLDVSFSYEDIKSCHIKNFKGLFYSAYGLPIPDKYEITIIAEGDEGNHNAQIVNNNYREFLNYDKEWQHIGHPKIFKYKMKAMIQDEDDADMFFDGKNIENAIGFVCSMEYANRLKPLVLAQLKDNMGGK